MLSIFIIECNLHTLDLMEVTMRRQRSIHNQMVLRIVLTVTIALTVIYMCSYDAIRTTIHHNTQMYLNTHAEMAVHEMEVIIERQKLMVETLASLLSGAYQQEEPFKEIDYLIEAYAEQSVELIHSYWFVAESDYQDQGRLFTWYGLDAAGDLINYGQDYSIDPSLAHYRGNLTYNYYHGAVEEGGIYVSDPYMGDFSKLPLISISIPLYDEHQQLIGVAGVDMYFQAYYDHLMSLNIEPNGSMVLVSNDGRQLFEAVSRNNKVDTSHAIDEHTQAMLKQAIDSSDGTTFLYDEEKNRYYHILAFNEKAWNVVMITPADDIGHVMNRVFTISLITLIIFVAAVYYFVQLWVNRLITKPIQQLVDLASRVEAGDYSQPVDMKMDNEWGQLADHMNGMLLTLDHQEKLEQEMKRMSSLKVVGEMAAALSHEIRNPLTTVRGFLQLLRNRPEYEKEHVYFDTMIEEILRANTIITEYLSLCQNKLSVFQMHSLNDIIEQISPLSQAAAVERCQHIVYELQTLPMITLDQKEIRQLLHNLIRNGLEAMIEYQTLHIRTYPLEQEVVLEIKDEGIGFDPVILKQAGTPFLTNKSDGTGLGLAICYRIVERHKGHIRIESKPGETIVYVYFPMNGC